MKKHVLIINTIGLYFEGITSVIYNYINSMDKFDLDIDFIAFEPIEDEIKEKFNKLGKIIIVPNRKSCIKGYIKELNAVLKSKYDVVHIHGNSGTMAIDAFFAKLHNSGNIIVHCHNTTCNHPIINKILVPVMKICADKYIGCSFAAGAWLYGKSPYLVLNNAIDIDKFKYNEKTRQLYRQEFNIVDELTIGHVGHFTERKNHEFLIEVFKEIHNILPNSKLLLISDGPDFQKIREKVSGMGLENSVIFTGARNDINKLYQAMDIFILPSLWEGLPVTMLEAQAAALPMLVSSCITRDAICTDRIIYKSLEDGALKWAEQVIEIYMMNFCRKDDMKKMLQDKGFDINNEAKKLKSIYTGTYNTGEGD